MDSLIWDHKNGFESDHVAVPGCSDCDDVSGFELKDIPFVQTDPDSRTCESSSYKSSEGDSTEENDLSDAVLKYISQVLMEDDSEDRVCTIQDSALQVAEKSFYDILAPNGNFPAVETNEENDDLRGKNKIHQEESELEYGRSKKLLAPCAEESFLHEMFDKIVLVYGENDEPPLHASDEFLQNGVSKGSNGGIQKRVSKRERVDTRALLIQCVQALTNDDLRSANELLKQIRWHSSPFGDKSQRLSDCFANSLDARLAGTGHLLYSAIDTKNMSDVNVLKALKFFISAFPFMKISNFFSTQMILELAEKARTVHIIHFGIYHGLQWPPLVQRLSKRPGGPPKVRITGVEYPQPGFRPSARVEETGQRLANYCKKFDVPFEYNCVAKKWETITIEDFRIEEDEMVVVSSFYRFNFLLDDSVSENCPRDGVLKLIKTINPNLFIHGIANGTYNSPFLVSRFREAFCHFSALFDMFEANVAREVPERMVFEREIYGKQILNVMACEGSERIERPETFKQWQVRHLRAGFKQLPLNQEVMNKARAMVNSQYHRYFFVDENIQWVVQGWKGRVIFGLSFWKSA